MSCVPPSRPSPRGQRFRIGPVAITPLLVVLAILFVGSTAVIGWAVASVKDASQVTLLGSGFLVLAAAFTLTALASLRGMWRAAGMARSGRALGLALVGGFAALGAMGSVTAALILTLVWAS